MFKKIVLAAAFFGSMNAVADIQSVAKGTTGISPLVGEVVDVQPLCPDGVVCFTNGTVVTVRYTLQGCLDTFVDLGASAVQVDGQLKVYASAANLHNSGSLRAFCAAMPTETRTYTFIMQFGDVDVTFLGNQQ